MTVQIQTPRVQFNGNGATTVYSFPFLIDEAADLQVYVGTTLKLLNTDYTVPAGSIANQSGGTITFTVAPPSGQVVTITRSMPLQRTVDYQTDGAFNAEDVNTDIDRLWMKDQEVADTLNRTIVQPNFDVPANMTLPIAAARAGGALAFDSSGNVVTVTPIGRWRGTWTTATAYNFGDIVVDGANGLNSQNLYYCVAANTSGTWATDLGNGVWQLALNAAAALAAISNNPIQLTVIGGSNVYLIAVAGVIIGAVCDATIANGSLPTSTVLNGVTYNIRAAFSSGLVPGFTLTTSGGVQWQATYA